MIDEKNSSRVLNLKIVTPEKTVCDLDCNSVILISADSAVDGSNGGSVGIRPGHTPAMLALAPDSIAEARKGGLTVLRIRVSSGFASVSRDGVRVLADSAEPTDL